VSDDILRQLAGLVQDRYFGKYRGIVRGHEQAPQRGRVSVEVPAVLGNLQVLAEICVPYAGDGTGLMLLPEVGSGCWVEFEGGDPSYPIWVGAFWGDGQMPDPMGGTNPRLLKTASCELRLDDGTRTLTALSDQGATLTLDGAGQMDAGATGGKVRVETGTAKLSKGQKGVEVNTAMTSINGGNLDVT
jgi:hypothetical protein